MPVFKPPIGVVNNAKKAIQWREEYPKETSSAGTHCQIKFKIINHLVV